MSSQPENVSAADAYDVVADAYAETYTDELTRKPFDREVLGRFAADLTGPGLIADIGCGPGQVARFLAGLGNGDSSLTGSTSPRRWWRWRVREIRASASKSPICGRCR